MKFFVKGKETVVSKITDKLSDWLSFPVKFELHNVSGYENVSNYCIIIDDGIDANIDIARFVSVDMSQTKLVDLQFTLIFDYYV